MRTQAFHAPGTGNAIHRATLYRADETARRGVMLVMAHGAGGGQSHPFMVRYGTGLAERGLDVVTFDFPYMQAGRRTPDRAPVLEEAFRRVVAAAVAQPEMAARKLFIGGKSMGGRMATHLAAAPDTWPQSAPPPAGVIVFGYPLNPPGGPSKRSPDRVSHLAKITLPVLIVQGTRDNFGGPEAIREAMPRASVHEVNGGNHSLAAKFDAEIFEAVCDFVGL